MGPFELFNHLLNFVAPALWIAVLLALVARIFIKKQPLSPVLYRQVAINFIVALSVLVLGLVFFGRDGKMVTYTGMALLCATSQWFLLRGWRG